MLTTFINEKRILSGEQMQTTPLSLLNTTLVGWEITTAMLHYLRAHWEFTTDRVLLSYRFF